MDVLKWKYFTLMCDSPGPGTPSVCMSFSRKMAFKASNPQAQLDDPCEELSSVSVRITVLTSPPCMLVREFWVLGFLFCFVLCFS